MFQYEAPEKQPTELPAIRLLDIIRLERAAGTRDTNPHVQDRHIEPLLPEDRLTAFLKRASGYDAITGEIEGDYERIHEGQVIVHDQDHGFI
jgi:hypothetical protein